MAARKNTTPAAKTERQEFGHSYYAYAGKRISAKGKLVDSYLEVSQEGKRISPDSGAWLIDKFNFVKRPKLGAIYEIIWAKPEQKSFYIRTELEAFVAAMDEQMKDWQIEDKLARAQDERAKQMNKALNKDEMGKLTLEELRDRMSKAHTHAQRTVLMSLIIEYLNS